MVVAASVPIGLGPSSVAMWPRLPEPLSRPDPFDLIANAEHIVRATDRTIAHSRESLDDTRTIIAESNRAIDATRRRIRPEDRPEAPERFAHDTFCGPIPAVRHWRGLSQGPRCPGTLTPSFISVH
jgi:hypothetical protein